MQLIRGLHNLTRSLCASVVTIGNFDGVHLGHQQIIRNLVAKARALEVPATVICFEPLPREFFAKEDPPARISSLRAKLALFAEHGVDRVLVLKFNDQLRSLTADQFVSRILVEGLAVKHLIVGDDFRFGCDRQGNFEFLLKQGQQFGFDVVETSTLVSHNERISSTRIRRLLKESNLYMARKLLGRPYGVSGRVIYGQQLGRTLGVPTANIRLNVKRPAVNGVFAVRVRRQDGSQFCGVANIGARPTVALFNPMLEVHIFNLTDDLYGEGLDVEFCHKIRDIQRFANTEQLKQQIQADIQTAKHYFKMGDLSS